MSALEIVIADSDEEYIIAFMNFFSSNYGKKYSIKYFTDETKLINYAANKTMDILLIDSAFSLPENTYNTFKTTIMLTNGDIFKVQGNIPSNIKYINKFQHGEKLISNVINIYLEQNNNTGKEIFISGNKEKTKIVSVYSPIGGAGKTTTSINCCYKLNNMGLKTFYLNLESIPSIASFFNCESEQNLSNIFYYIKERNKNLLLKIEAARQIDAESGIHFFPPTDSISEFDEVTAEDILVLLDTLRESKQYDVIFVDNDSNLSNKSIKILENSDDILLIATTDKISISKLKLFNKEIERLYKKTAANIKDKLYLIINKCNNNLHDESIKDIFSKDIFAKVILNAEFMISQNSNAIYKSDAFSLALNEVHNKIFQEISSLKGGSYHG